MSETRAEAAAPQDASTVLLLRDGEGGVEVFMERRHVRSDFVGGAYVFPGGRVDPEDGIDERLCRGPSDAEASSRLGISAGGGTFYAAALRECFEEAGVLLAYRHGQQDLLTFADPEVEERFKEHRLALNRGERTLVDIVEAESLELATDHIQYWAHWITPEGQPRRFDTRFFVAHAPEHQTAHHDDWELTNSAWVTPQEAIRKARRREWMIIFPTLKNLEQLAQYPTADSAVEATRAQSEVLTMQPRMLLRDGTARLVLPGDDGYEAAARDFSGLRSKRRKGRPPDDEGRGGR